MLPEKWIPTELEKIATFKSGGTPSKQHPDYWNGGLPWISGKDLKSHLLSNSIDTLTREGYENAKIAPAGTSLVLVRGMTLLKEFPVGHTTKPMAFNQDIKAMIAKEGIEPLFLSYLLIANSHKIRQLVTTAGHGTGRLETELLKRYPINLPPTNEQTKIAQILSTWDQAIATTEKLIENSKAQKKALMQQLLTGKKRLPGFSGEWHQSAINKMGQVVSGGTPNTNVDIYWGGNILWMTPTDVTALKNRFIRNTKRKLTKQGIDNSSATIIPERSLLICTRATIGIMAISTTNIATNQGFKNLIPNLQFDVEFLYYLFCHFEKDFLRMACGSTFLEVSKKDFERLSFKHPSMDEQKSIASVLSIADNEIELQQKILLQLEQEKKALMQQLLTGKRRVKVAP